MDSASSREALRDLRAARRRRHVSDLDWVDALYRVYLMAIFGAVAVALISGALGDARADQHAVDQIDRYGPALMGLLPALAIAGGIRSGSRGGPLAIEAADVHHVLLSPVDRAAALRPPALRTLRHAVFTGAVVGAVAGNLAFRRLPGSAAEWLVSLTTFGAVVALWGLASAMVASDRRLSRRVVAPVAIAVVAWSLGDYLLGWKTSPATMLGELSLWPLEQSFAWTLAATLGMAAALITALLGIRWLAGISLEATKRRADLVTQLRFAVTLQDVRSVILLRRQLAAELPRRQPWVRTSGRIRSDPVWVRDWQSFLRWPAVRVTRVSVLGAVAGITLCGAWAGTTPLVVLAAVALLIASFDAVEPLAQEMDHPTRRDLLPVPAGLLIRRHLIAPTLLMVGVGVGGLGAALIVGPAERAIEVGAVMLVPTALLVVCCGALSATNDPYAHLVSPAIGYAQTATPFVLAVWAVAPLLAARDAAHHGMSPAGAAASSELVIVAVSAVVIWFLSRRVAKRVAVKP